MDLDVWSPSKRRPYGLRALWRLGLRLHSHLFARSRHNRLVLEEVAGRPIIVLPGVMNPNLFRTGAFLARTLLREPISAQCRVLDMGSGTGIGAVFAAERAHRVVAVDINGEAVRCTRINALLNHLEGRITVYQGDLFAPVPREKFELVLFNPPFFRGRPAAGFDQAWRSCNAVERFALDLPAHLANGGQALVVLSSDGDQETFLRAFGASGLVCEVAARRDFINEILTVYRFGRDVST
jgi:HemK-related putative methylase